MHWIARLLGSLVLAMTLSGAASGQDLENTLVHRPRGRPAS